MWSATQLRKHVLGDLAGCKAQNHRGCRLRWYVEIHAIEPKEYDYRSEGRPLVAVNERMIARNAEAVGGRKRRNAAFAVTEFVKWSRQRGFEQTAIANAVRAAEQSKLLGMEIEDGIDIEPYRLVHFASAL